MLLVKDDDQQLINKAEAFLIKAPMMTVPQIVCMTKFTLRKLKIVHCRCKFTVPLRASTL